MTLVDKIKSIQHEIREQYLSDDTPWVVGYSGGKDSTAVLQLIMYALAKLPPEQLTKEIHVLSNDTLVENPAVVAYIDQQLKLIERIGRSKLFGHRPDLFQVFKSVPKIEDRFWINLIGKGYPAPNRWFRWCTERMKINPTNDYILQTVSKHGKAIIVLGARREESTNRAQSIDKYDLKSINENQRLRKHTLANAWVYGPISDLTTQEVWGYLMQVPNFWGGDNKRLIAMYRNASDGANECPLVIDTSTSSCGSSRFGCWVCTVVDRDKSMENLIDNGEEWMLPLLELRNLLADYRNDTTKRMEVSRAGKDHMGPFRYDVRAELLARLLQAETKAGLQLISRNELAAIQMQWNYDGCFDYSVDDIYFQVKNQRIMLDHSLGAEREREELDLLREVAAEHGFNPDHIRELMMTERDFVTFLRRRNIFDDIHKKIERFTKEEVAKQPA
ncbi:DNA phosphorothioation system sulfurtransferase DndC [Spirosoma arcticum]